MVAPIRFLLSAGTVLLMAGTAAAQGQPMEPQPIGLSIGLRFGYGIPGGKLGRLAAGADNTSLSEGVKGMVPFGLDLGFRLMPHLAVGATVQYGLGLANEDMGGCKDCDIDVVGIGAAVYAHALPGGKFDPWAGLGLGYEILSISNKQLEGEAQAKLEGFQFLIVQAGGDFATGGPITLGPFFSVSLGKYDKAKVTFNPGNGPMTLSRDVQETAWHHWVTAGIQGSFNF